MKKITISISIVLAAIIAVFGGSYLLSFHKVTFTLENGTSAISIYSSKDKKVKESLSGGSVFLQEGGYYLIPEGENISKDKINFSIENEDKTIAVNPSLSKEYLEKLLEKEGDTIKAAVVTKYPSLISGYTMESGTLYERGDWYGGLLVPKVSDRREQKDPYRIVLYKKDDNWEVIRRPEYILTSSRYKEVPVNILREINALVDEPGN